MTASIPNARQRNLGVDQDDPIRSPDNIAPPVVYLASEASDWLNGRVIGASGYRISLYNEPEVIREISSSSPWGIEETFANIERAFRPAIEPSRVFGRRRRGEEKS